MNFPRPENEALFCRISLVGKRGSDRCRWIMTGFSRKKSYSRSLPYPFTSKHVTAIEKKCQIDSLIKVTKWKCVKFVEKKDRCT